MRHSQLTFAREYRELTQSELANSIKGLSQSNLSKFEKGFDVISEDLFTNIISFLNFPSSFFDKKINTQIENAHYRKKSAISKSIVQKFERTCNLVGFIVDHFSDSLEWPEFKLQQLNVDEGFSPTYVARYTRKLLKLDDREPVKNINELLESNGVIIYEIIANEKFDGVSFFTPNGYPIIIVNKSSSNDRKRLTIAHELGHILLHHSYVSEFRDKEKEAYEFAGEFLMPGSIVKESLRNLRLSDLGPAKSYWLTSMASIIVRARNLGSIDNDRYRYLLIEMSRSGYNRNEPINVPIDEPRLFSNSLSSFLKDLQYSIDDICKYLSLPKDILDDIFSSQSTPKLRIAYSAQS